MCVWVPHTKQSAAKFTDTHKRARMMDNIENPRDVWAVCESAKCEDETFSMHLHQFLGQTQELCPIRYATSSGEEPETFAYAWQSSDLRSLWKDIQLNDCVECVLFHPFSRFVLVDL